MNWAQAYSDANGAYERCCDTGNALWRNRWMGRMQQLVGTLPHGAGIDGDLKVKRCTGQHITITFDFHHMDENGGYDGWSYYAIFCTATFSGVDVRVQGRDAGGTKDYLADLFHAAVTSEAPEVPWAEEQKEAT